MTTYNPSKIEKNINSGMLCTVFWAELYFLTYKKLPAVMSLAGLFWLIYWVSEHISQRWGSARHVLGLREILRVAIYKKGNSLILLLPLMAGCFIFMGYYFHRTFVGILFTLLYALMVFLLERYPENVYL